MTLTSPSIRDGDCGIGRGAADRWEVQPTSKPATHAINFTGRSYLHAYSSGAKPIGVPLLGEQPFREIHPLLELGHPALHRFEMLTELADFRLVFRCCATPRPSTEDRLADLRRDDDDGDPDGPAGDHEHGVLI